jgi:hypothetical protein
MNIKKYFLVIATFLMVMQFNLLKAEIQDVTISWTAQECLTSCVKGLNDQFRKIPGVAEISINQGAGQATLHWQPNASFSYYPIKIAMQLIGLSINNLKVRVRGTIVSDSATTFRIVSIGDGTSFTLLGIPAVQRNQFSAQYSAQNRQLSPDMIAQLAQAQQNEQIATIYGPLFEYWRSPPMYLIIENIQFSKN